MKLNIKPGWRELIDEICAENDGLADQRVLEALHWHELNPPASPLDRAGLKERLLTRVRQAGLQDGLV